jgi:predicted dehydrogenase
MYAIVGSGFGLYGYLPAIVESLGERVVLPRAYEAKMRARAELAPLISRVEWVDDMQASLERADTVVIATPPARQVEVARRCLGLGNVRRMLLEKPPAPTPEEAVALLEDLRRHARRYRIGFTLLHTAWRPALRWPARASADGVDITWTFMAHHFAKDLSNWKRRRSEGGGVLRFFGIHLLAFLGMHGYEDVRDSVFEAQRADEPRCWSATFTGPEVPPCRVRVDSGATENIFRIEARSGTRSTPLVALADPFQDEPAIGAHDRRVGVLERLLASFGEDDARYEELYDNVNRLWAKAEG